MDQLLVIICTYNEMDNLPTLVDKVSELVPQATILVVDDSSPDGTNEWCKNRVSFDERFRFISRAAKLGLGSATIAGMEFALEHGYPFVATMDADWSHNPNDLVEMWAMAQELAVANDDEGDFGAVFGSRYVAGGKIEGWPLFRRITSKVVNFLTRLALRIPTKDNTSALRIYSAEALDVVDVQSIESRGYGYLEEMACLLHRNEFRVVEYPITFIDRQSGKSKTSISVGLEILRSIARTAIRR